MVLNSLNILYFPKFLLFRYIRCTTTKIIIMKLATLSVSTHGARSESLMTHLWNIKLYYFNINKYSTGHFGTRPYNYKAQAKEKFFDSHFQPTFHLLL